MKNMTWQSELRELVEALLILLGGENDAGGPAGGGQRQNRRVDRLGEL